MSEEKLFSRGNVWFSASVGAIAGLVVVSLIVGFALLPYADASTKFASLWDAICSAAGVPRSSPSAPPAKAMFRTSDVVLTTELAGPQDARSIGRGATLAMQCAICHGAGRPGSQVDTPELEGQPAAAVFKQLRDFKAGARTNAIMSPFAAKLSEQDMQDIAAYYGYLPRQPGPHPDAAVAAPRIVSHGAPLRNVAACGACHSAGETKLGTPWLDGQSPVYIKAQLQAFASSTRRNDISEQMRNIARQLTATEIDEAAKYYAAQP